MRESEKTEEREDDKVGTSSKRERKKTARS